MTHETAPAAKRHRRTSPISPRRRTRSSSRQSRSGRPSRRPIRSQRAEPSDAQTKATTRADDQEPRRRGGPVHRPLIRRVASEDRGRAPPARQIPEFTIRQPGGAPANWVPSPPSRAGAHGGGGQQFQGNRSHGGGNATGPRGGPRSSGGLPPQGQGAGRCAATDRWTEAVGGKEVTSYELQSKNSDSDHSELRSTAPIAPGNMAPGTRHLLTCPTSPKTRPDRRRLPTNGRSWAIAQAAAAAGARLVLTYPSERLEENVRETRGAR